MESMIFDTIWEKSHVSIKTTSLICKKICSLELSKGAPYCDKAIVPREDSTLYSLSNIVTTESELPADMC